LQVINYKAVTDRRLRRRFATAYIVRSYRLAACCFSHGPRPSRLAALSGWLAVSVLHRHPRMWPIMCKYDVVVHKTEVNNVSQSRHLAMDIGNMHTKVDKYRTCGSGNMLADRQTDGRTDILTDTVITILGLPYQGRSNNRLFNETLASEHGIDTEPSQPACSFCCFSTLRGS